MNLIVTCARRMEEDAVDEIASVLEGLGDATPEVRTTGMSGILTVRTTVKPADFVGRVRGMVTEEPWSVRYMLRVIPVHKTVPTGADQIADACRGYRDVIGGSTYRVTVEKRHSKISSAELISRIADGIQGKVSLEEPAWEVLVEVLGAETGVSLVRPGDVISVEKLKRASE